MDRSVEPPNGPTTCKQNTHEPSSQHAALLWLSAMGLYARSTRHHGDRAIDFDSVAAELSRPGRLRLAFARSLEERFEAQTKSARAWIIRLTVPLGMTAFLLFCLVDSTLLSDLGWTPTLVRVVFVLPAGLFAMWMCSRFSAFAREAYIGIAMTMAMLIPAGFIFASRGPASTYTMFEVLLVNMFGNVTLRLRFPWACAFSFATLLTTLAVVPLRPDIPGGIAGAMLLAALICVTFGIVANHQLERAERVGFLMTLRESLRSAQLHADKESYSALSSTDPLTGLANRRRLSERLKAWRAERTHARRPLAIVMVDVDHFKRYNDRYGHPAGDVCLRRIAQTMATCLRDESDLLARYGGEEFVVMLPDAGPEEAGALAERLCRAVAALQMPHAHREDGVSTVTISAGVASDTAGSPRRARSLFDAADAALYQAKRSGRNRHAVSPAPAPPIEPTPSDLAPLPEYRDSDAW